MEDEAAIKAIVAPAALKRGKELLDSKKLLEVQFDGDSCERASALCEGSNPGDSYNVSISIDPSEPNKQPTYRCSCPAGRGMCKHAIALLLRRVQHLQSLQTGASPKSNDDEDDPLPPPPEKIEWVRNPEKLTPDPAARRALPAWMTAAAVEKPKKGRATKKQKLEDDDADDVPQTSAKKPPARKKSSPRGKKKKADEEEEEQAAEDEEALDEEEEAPKPAKKATSRQTRNSKGGGGSAAAAAAAGAAGAGGSDRDRGRDKAAGKAGDEPGGDVAAKPKRARSRKTVSDDDDNDKRSPGNAAAAAPAPAPEVGRERGKRRLKKLSDDADETGDPTLDELMNIAQQNLDQQDSPPDVEDDSKSPVKEADTQPAKKKAKLNDSMFSLSGWKSRSAAAPAAEELGNSGTKAERGSSEAKAARTVGSDEAEPMQAGDQNITVAAPARRVSNDTLEDEMLGMFLGGYVSKKNPNQPEQIKKPEPASVPNPISKPAIPKPAPKQSAMEASRLIEETGATKSIQPKPKKKSSLKDQIGALLK